MADQKRKAKSSLIFFSTIARVRFACSEYQVLITKTTEEVFSSSFSKTSNKYLHSS